MLKEYYIDGVRIIEHQATKTLFINSDFIERSMELIIEQKINDIAIVPSSDYKENNINFLKKYTWLEDLRLQEGDYDIQGIQFLKNLKEISINKKEYTDINFNNFPKLESCFINYKKENCNLFNRISLRNLTLYYFKEKNLELFYKLVNLTSLKLENSTILEIKGVEKLVELELLDLYNVKLLASFHQIGELKNLKRLDITSCKDIGDISWISNLKELESLHLTDAGLIETLDPIKNLPNLKHVTFSGKTKILDGNMETLIGKTFVIFTDHKHYSYKQKEIEKLNNYVKPKQSWEI